MTMVKKIIQTRLDETKKKNMELIATKLQTFIKNAPKEKGEKPHNRRGTMIRRRKKVTRALLKPIYE